MPRIKHVGTFIANHLDGKPEPILKWQDIIDGNALNEQHQGLGGMRLKTTDGRAVNRIEKGKYEIVDFDMIPLTSDDPNAI